MIDRCPRWYHSLIIPNTEEPTLLEALDSWVRLHGPPKVLYMDQETGIQAGADALQYLHRHTIDYRPRAQGQQVAYIDRRGALVREAIHKVVGQLKKEHIKMEFKYVLSEATFCSNALLSVNGSTPYNAVYGRVPNLLPSIDQPDAINEDSLNLPGTIRHCHRLREISVQAMVEETALQRTQRALQTRTLPAGEREGYQCGDLVDFYREPGTKDASGWIGPAKVIDPHHMSEGTITVKHVHRPIEIRVGDLRRHMQFAVFLAAIGSAYSGECVTWRDCRMYIETHLKDNTTALMGDALSAPGMSEHRQFAKTVTPFLARILKLHNICAVRIGKGRSKTPGAPVGSVS